MSEPNEQNQADMDSGTGTPGPMECDFCREPVASVRRVALDGEYERLRTPHAVQYACSDCFEKKDRQRLGF